MGKVMARRSVALVVAALSAVVVPFLAQPVSHAAGTGPGPESVRVADPFEIDSGGVRPGVRAFAAGEVGSNPIKGPGTYDVVVVGLSTPAGASPATPDNSAAVVAATDALWSATTGGRYRLALRGFAAGASAMGVCGVSAAGSAATAAVAPEIRSLTPSTGRAGVLVVVVTPNDSCAPYAGQAWLGYGAMHLNGYWSTTTADVFAHEAGHNFGLGHASALVCQGSAPLSLAQHPAWPCQRRPYLDATSFMGSGGLSSYLNLGRLNAAHLDLLGVLPANARRTVTDEADNVEINALYASGAGVKSVGIAVAGVVRYQVEYRPAMGSEAGLSGYSLAGGAMAPGAGVYLRVVNDSSATFAHVGNPDLLRDTSAMAETLAYAGDRSDSYFWQFGLPAGAQVPLADGRLLKVISTGDHAVVRISRTPDAVEPDTQQPAVTGLAFAGNGTGASDSRVFQPGGTIGATWANSVDNRPGALRQELLIDGAIVRVDLTGKLRALTATMPGMGIHTSHLRVTDAAANSWLSPPFQFFVDGSAPTVTSRPVVPSVGPLTRAGALWRLPGAAWSHSWDLVGPGVSSPCTAPSRRDVVATGNGLLRAPLSYGAHNQPLWIFAGGSQVVTTTVKDCAGNLTARTQALRSTVIPAGWFTRTGAWGTQARSEATMSTSPRTTRTAATSLRVSQRSANVAVVLAKQPGGAPADIIVNGRFVRRVITSGGNADPARGRFVAYVAGDGLRTRTIEIRRVGVTGAPLTVDGIVGW